MEQKASTWAKSDAYRTFEVNLEPLSGLVEPKIKRLQDVVKTAQAIVNDKIPADTSPDLEVFRIAVDQIGEEVGELAKETRLSIQWLCIVLVTFTSSYLEEGLVSIALENPDLMKEANPLPQRSISEAETGDDPRSETIHRWADQLVRSGPKTWFALLRRLGARGYREDTQFLLSHLWDTRNRVVHGRGTADAAYAKTYASLSLARGDRIPITIKTLRWWLDGLSHFTETTDRFFAQYAGSEAHGLPGVRMGD